ncbi:MAG: hypothetical protein FWC51_02460 [Proteobacteria bacterium]|nr:hypothetical protein [Pseudomonadota bacterium]
MPKKKIQKKTKPAAAKRAPVKPVAAKPVVKEIRIEPVKKPAPAAAAKPAERNDALAPKADGSRFALYVYWLIIVFFVGSTFYILGRGYSIIHPLPATTAANNVEVTDAATDVPVLDVSSLSDADRVALAAQYAQTGKAKLISADPSGAIADLNVAITADPSAVDPYIYRGEAYMQNADYANAMNDLNTAIQLDSQNSVALFDRAVLYVHMENFDSALVDLGSALNANNARPSDILTDHDIYSKRAQIMLWQKDFQGAVNDYNAAINASGSAPNYLDYAGRAEAWTAMGQWKNAADDYLSAITIISNTIGNAATNEQRNVMSRNALAYFQKSGALHVKMGDIAAAKADLQAAQTLAATLGDNETAAKLQTLIDSL